MSRNVDSDGESFIPPPKSASREDIVQAWDDYANLYTVIHASGINMYFFNIIIYCV